MQRDPRVYLWDVRACADHIRQFLVDASPERFAVDVLLRSAVERQFEIIGEALNQLSKVAPELAARVPDVPRVVAFRNILIHGYATLDHELVWRIAHESLPGLRAAVDALLDEEGGDPSVTEPG